jgi:hypothetical protein
MSEPVLVEETRRDMAKMVVEDSDRQTSASRLLWTMAGKAREGWCKVMRMLEGKKIVRNEGMGKMVRQTEKSVHQPMD